MSKIVTAANAMIANPKKIGSVVKGDYSEIFFEYDNKHKWSIRPEGEANYTLYYYPGDYSIEALVMLHDYDWDMVNMVKYSSSEIGTVEARNTFSELYTLVNEKVFGVDVVLDNIIGDLL